MTMNCLNCKHPVTWDDDNAGFTHTDTGPGCDGKPGYRAAPATYPRCGKLVLHTGHATGAVRAQCARPIDGHDSHTAVDGVSEARETRGDWVILTEPVRWGAR